jgi:hypothetical protein
MGRVPLFDLRQPRASCAEVTADCPCRQQLRGVRRSLALPKKTAVNQLLGLKNDIASEMKKKKTHPVPQYRQVQHETV